MLSFLGGVLGNFILGMAKWLIGCFAIFRAGEKAQQGKDIAANESVIQKQRDDATNAGAVDPLGDLNKL